MNQMPVIAMYREKCSPKASKHCVVGLAKRHQCSSLNLTCQWTTLITYHQLIMHLVLLNKSCAILKEVPQSSCTGPCGLQSTCTRYCFAVGRQEMRPQCLRVSRTCVGGYFAGRPPAGGFLALVVAPRYGKETPS